MVIKVIWLLSLGVFPLFQGGYFYYEALAFGLVQSLILLWQMLGKHHEGSREAVSGKRYTFKLMTLMVVLAAVASFYAVNVEVHLFGVLKLITGFLFVTNLYVFMVREGKSFIDLWLKVVVYSGVLMSGLSLTVILFFSKEGDVFQHFMQDDRFGGFFQYANSYGIYLLAVLILLYSLKVKNEIKALFALILVSNIIMTQSRGVFYLFVLCMVIVAGIRYKDWIVTLGVILGGFVGRFVLVYLQDIVEVGRGVAITENTSPWLSRLLYYEDGLSILLKFPFGLGFGGYNDVQRMYQTGAAYKVKFIHSAPLQFGLDYGVLAMVVYMVLLLLPIIWFFKNRVKIKDNPLVLYMLAAMVISGHSFIDFNMQFPVVLMLWLGLLISIEGNFVPVDKGGTGYRNVHPDKVGSSHTKVLTGLALGLMSIVFIYFGLVSYYEYNEDYEKAYNMLPGYTDTVSGIINHEDEYGHMERVKIVEETLKSHEYYIKGFAFLRDSHYNDGDLESAAYYGKKVVELAPLRLDYYERYLMIAYESCSKKYFLGTLKADDPLLLDITNIAQYMKMLERERKNNYTIKHQVDYNLTEVMDLLIENGNYLKNKLMETEYED